MTSLARAFGLNHNNPSVQPSTTNPPTSPQKSSSSNPHNGLNFLETFSMSHHNGDDHKRGATLINEQNLAMFPSLSTSMPKNTADDKDMKKKLKILKKEYLKQKAELERLAQIALNQQEEIKQKDYQIRKFKQQSEEQTSKIGELESQLQIERDLCEGAIRMNKPSQQSPHTPNAIDEKTQSEDVSLVLDEGLTTKDILEKTYQYLKDDTYTFMLSMEEYQEEETISSLKQEIASLREETFSLREEKHKLENEKLHLFDLVHQLTLQLNLEKD